MRFRPASVPLLTALLFADSQPRFTTLPSGARAQVEQPTTPSDVRAEVHQPTTVPSGVPPEAQQPGVRATAQQPDPIPSQVRTAAETIAARALRRDVEYLASDALQGRATPSSGLDSAAQFIVRRLRTLGLEPLGDGGSYLQHYEIRDVELDTAASFIEFGGRRYRYGDDFLVILFNDSVTLSAPLSWVGHGIRVPKKGIDPYSNVDVTGRIIIAHGPQVLPPGESYESLGVMSVDWQLPAEVALERNAPATLLVPPARMLGRWNTVRRNPSMLSSEELAPVVPSAYMRPPTLLLWIKPQVAEALLAAAPGGARPLLERAGSGDFAPSFDLPREATVTIRIAARSVAQARPYNVVARVSGSDPALRAEAVTLAAHLDGAVDAPLDDGAGDTIFNAADDNASGSAGILAVAAAMVRAPRPKRSVIFLWDSGEEMGLWGSRYFAAHPPVPLERIAAHFNVDMIGRSRPPGPTAEGDEELSATDEVYVVGPKVLSSALDSLLADANRRYLNLRLNHRFDDAEHEYFYPRTDAAPFLERGVLTVDFFTGMHRDYHAPSDEVQHLDFRKLERVSRTIFVSAWLLANQEARPHADKGFPASVQRYR